MAKYLFANENVDAYYLEFDDERSGGFEPLRFVSDDKKVVLGLITTKSPVLESEELIKERIRQAAKYVRWNVCTSVLSVDLHRVRSEIN